MPSIPRPDWFRKLDDAIGYTLQRWGDRAARYALAAIFIWFGILKPFGRSPAEGMMRDLWDVMFRWVPLLDAGAFVAIVGWWEVAIGVCLLFRPLLRVALGLLALQMIGTFMPLFVLPDHAWQTGGTGWAPTTEGQYIIKNLVVIAAALVVGGNVGSRQAAEHI